MSELLHQALAWTDEQHHPRSIRSTGDSRLRSGIGDAPDTQAGCFEFESFTLEFESRTYLGSPGERSSAGVWFHGAKSAVHFKASQTEPRFSRFIVNIRDRRRNLDGLAACQRAASLALLANVLAQTGAEHRGNYPAFVQPCVRGSF